jgi:cytochrome c oxidase subunit II
MRDRSAARAARRGWWILGFAALTLVLAACSSESGPSNRQNSLRPAGQPAKQVDNLFTPILWVAIAVGIFIIAATIFVAVRYRQRKGEEGRPKQIHGNTPLEIGWTLVPALILAVIAVPTVSVIFDLAEKPANPLEITVVGKQWWWQFDYPKQAGVDKKIVTADEMHIPTGRDVFLTLTACDDSLGTTGNRPNCNVIHSFWVPELAGKRDVVPGHTNTMKLRTDKPGTYLGQCAEYCGLSHANMRFRVIAQSPSDFDAWAAGQNEGPAVPLSGAGQASTLFTKTFQCTNCHTTEDSTTSVYGPNLTHLASRTTFASGYYDLNRQNLVQWILNAPGMIPMQSEDCRLPPPATCVGMPSFTENTPKGYPVMTKTQAETLADYLLQLK